MAELTSRSGESRLAHFPVTFFAVELTMKDKLVAELRAYSHQLAPNVEQSGAFLSYSEPIRGSP